MSPHHRRSTLLRGAIALLLAAAVVPAVAGAHQYDIDDLGNTTPSPSDIPDLPPVQPSVTADAAIVVDRSSGEVLFSKSPDRLRASASTTKMMTGLLAIEAINAGEVSLDDTVTISSDVNDEGGGAAGLAGGDTISLRDLLHITLVPSKNDAASAVGTYIGSAVYRPYFLSTQTAPRPIAVMRPTDARTLFVNRMNARAEELGLDDTSYVDMSGRDPEDLNEFGNFPAQANCDGDDFDEPACAHHSTARDLAALARVVMDDPLFADIVATTSWTTTTWRRANGTSRNRTYDTSNQLLPGEPNAFPGAYGVKTGTSGQAGQNLVSAAAREGDDVIAVVLGSDDSGAPGDRFTDSTALLQYALGE